MRISIRGASENNLHNLDLEIDDGLTVVTGVSGSGKTSLVFDTVYHEARRALDLLLGRETREASLLGFEVARLVGAEPAHGFLTFYARFDLALLLELCWRVGADRADPRVAGLVDFIQGLQGSYGLWEYDPRPQVSRWLTFDLLRSLSRLSGGEPGEWLSLEPRTPFQPYPKKVKRY